MGEQPVVAYLVEAGRDVALQDPWSRSLAGKDDIALHHRIGGGSFLPEPVGVRVGSHLGDGVEGEQIEGLHRSIPHCRDAEGTLLAVTLRNEHPTQRSGAVPPLSQVEYCLHLLLWSVPDVAVDPWGVLPLPIRRWLSCLRQGGTGTPPPATYLLVQACQHLWLVVSNGVYQRFTSLGHTLRPSSRTARCWQLWPFLPVRLPPPPLTLH